MKLDDLIVLEYAANPCYTKVINLKDCRDNYLSVDLIKGTWIYQRGNYDERQPRIYKIGEMRHCSWGCPFGVIGVFDRTNTEQLSSMVYCAGVATDEPNYGCD